MFLSKEEQQQLYKEEKKEAIERYFALLFGKRDASAAMKAMTGKG